MYNVVQGRDFLCMGEALEPPTRQRFGCALKGGGCRLRRKGGSRLSPTGGMHLKPKGIPREPGVRVARPDQPERRNRKQASLLSHTAPPALSGHPPRKRGGARRSELWSHDLAASGGAAYINMYIAYAAPGFAKWTHCPYTTPLCSNIVAQSSPFVKYICIKNFVMFYPNSGKNEIRRHKSILLPTAHSNAAGG